MARPLPSGYTAQVGNLPIFGGERATPEAFGGAQGQAIQGIGQEVQQGAQQTLQTQESLEMRDAMAKGSQIQAQALQELDAAQKTGAPLEPIRQKMNAALQTLSEGYQTKMGSLTLESESGRSNEVYSWFARRIEAQRAADQARVDTQNWLTSKSPLLTADPSSLPSLEKEADAYVGTFTNLDPAARELAGQGLKQQLNLAAATVRMQSDPTGTLKSLELGDYHLTPMQRVELEARAKEHQLAQERQEMYQRTLAKAAASDASEKSVNDWLVKISNGQGNAHQILNDASLLPQAKTGLVSFLHSFTTELSTPTKSDPTTKNNLWLRLNAPIGDPNRITSSQPILDAVASGKLTTTDGTTFLNEWRADKDAKGSTFRQRLALRMQNVGYVVRSDPAMAGQPDLQASVLNELVSRAEQTAQGMTQHGLTPDDMLDPNNKHYFFTPGLIASVTRDVTAQHKDAVRKTAMMTTPTKFPDGTSRIWTGVGDPKNIDTWKVLSGTPSLADKIPQ